MSGRVLIVDDDQSMCRVLAQGLRARGYEIEWRGSAQDAIQALAGDWFDLVATDLRMTGMSGVQLVNHIVAHHPDVPVVVMTAFGSIEAAVETIRAGAVDFVSKPFRIDDLVVSIERALQSRRLRQELMQLREQTAQPKGFEGLLGDSPSMRQVYDLAERVAGSEVCVLITGESGTGKELVARAIHRTSGRSAGPFVALNCAAMPEALLESELFGHCRGAFTDAKASRRGLFLEANGGTIFLDEVGEMSLGMQAKLLRSLEQRAVRPVGGTGEVAFDARVLAATNLDLEAAVEDKRFREDLYYRLNVVRIKLPPLRSRGSDVLLLAQHFLAREAAHARREGLVLDADVGARLLAYPWPGNVRELQNCVARAVALSRSDSITVNDLPDLVRDHRPSRFVVATENPEDMPSLHEVERRYILSVLDAVGGNKTAAARILKLNRTTLHRKLAGRDDPGDDGHTEG